MCRFREGTENKKKARVMLELQPDLGDVHLARPASAATTRSALEAIKKKFELSAAAAAAGREASSEKFLLEKGRETSSWPVVVPSTGTPDAIEPPVKSNVAGGLVDSRGCAKPAKKIVSISPPFGPWGGGGEIVYSFAPNRARRRVVVV